mmetsp:Transcript_18672/g.43786  ORF Transcript_18672/g.43786 Transcript_18672/m.43786 type:complete len:212 (-) Transcript_18672:644-1279(-)
MAELDPRDSHLMTHKLVHQLWLGQVIDTPDSETVVGGAGCHQREARVDRETKEVGFVGCQRCNNLVNVLNNAKSHLRRSCDVLLVVASHGTTQNISEGDGASVHRCRRSDWAQLPQLDGGIVGAGEHHPLLVEEEDLPYVTVVAKHFANRSASDDFPDNDDIVFASGQQSCALAAPHETADIAPVPLKIRGEGNLEATVLLGLSFKRSVQA